MKKQHSGSKMRSKVFICKCNSPEHLIVVTFGDGEVYFNIHLVPAPFFQRLKNGIKYIFGYRSKYGDFDEFIFRKDDYKKLIKVAHYLKI